MLRVALVAACLLMMVVPVHALAAEEPAALPAWLQAQFEARGLDVAGEDVRVMRTVTSDGLSTTFEVPLSAILQTDPFAGSHVAPPRVPEVLAGDLTYHAMLQTNCAGYGIQQVAPGIGLIRDARWDLGAHVALGPLAGGRAVGTGADPTNVAVNAIAVLNTDTGMSLAAGKFSASYDRITIFGICLLGIGQMGGTGAWVFR